MHHRFLPFLTTILFCIYSNIVVAYSEKGHQIIAAIACQQLDSATRSNVLQFLEGTSFEEAALWMDQVRHEPQYAEMKPWHYINIEKGKDYKPTNNGNIINALEKILNEFETKQDLSNQQIKTNLMMLFHLIGDLHQPLHVGYGEDRGGNDFQVNFQGKGSNLHKIWDEVIIQDQNINLEDCMLKLNSLPREQLDKISNIDIVGWMNESRDLLGAVYGFNGHKLDEDYMKRMKPIVENRLVFAGLRLASIIDKYFKSRQYVVDSLRQIVNNDTVQILAADAAKYLGQPVIVCGKVFGGKAFKTFKLINVGDYYPKNPLNLYIKNNVRLPFEPVGFLQDKNICVTGIIILYRDKYEVVISSEDQIEILP